jgi:hypothetical protein
MPEKDLLAGAYDTFISAGVAVMWAFIGRLLYIFNLARMGRRKNLFTIQTLWELGIAIGMGVVAGGLAEYIGLKGLPGAGFISAASYLGPHVIELLLAYVSKKAGVDMSNNPPSSGKGNE